MPKYHGPQSFRRASRRTVRAKIKEVKDFTHHDRDGNGHYIEVMHRKGKPYIEVRHSYQVTPSVYRDPGQAGIRSYVGASYFQAADNNLFVLLLIMLWNKDQRKRMKIVSEIFKYRNKHPDC